MHPTATTHLTRLDEAAARSARTLNQVTWALVELVQSDEDGADHALEALVAFYTPRFAPQFAKHVQSALRNGRFTEEGDFDQQVACVLIDAIYAGETTRGTSFTGYAYPFILGEVTDMCGTDSSKQRPTEIREHRKVWEAYRQVEQEQGRVPTDQEVTDRVNAGRSLSARVSLDVVRAILQDRQAFESIEREAGAPDLLGATASIGGGVRAEGDEADGMPFGLPRLESNFPSGYDEVVSVLGLSRARSFVVLATLRHYLGIESWRAVRERLASDAPEFPEVAKADGCPPPNWAEVRRSIPDVPTWVPTDWPETQALFRGPKGTVLGRKGLYERYASALGELKANRLY